MDNWDVKAEHVKIMLDLLIIKEEYDNIKESERQAEIYKTLS